MNFSIKLKRILVLGIVVVGVIFLNKILISNQPESRSGFAVQPLSRGFSLIESGVQYEFYKDKLKSYPEPGSFEKFNYDGQTIKLGGQCFDYYYTILIYPQSADYRENPASAVFNKAFECPPGKNFEHEIDLKQINLAPGLYYLIVADQGLRDNWYNPRSGIIQDSQYRNGF